MITYISLQFPSSEFSLILVCRSPDGDFLIDYHPDCSNLFLATGGSGHAFKFFPVIGEKIVDAIQGCLEAELREIWRWKKKRENSVQGFWTTQDESRGGRRGMVLQEEMNGNP
jgi:sarcosine oxidase / L-pipecolate oxidase